MQTKFTKLATAMYLATAALAFSTSASALSSFENLIVTNGVTTNTAQDSSGEGGWRNVGGTWIPLGVAPGGTTLQVGDVIAGVFFMDSLNSVNIGSGTSYTGLAGLFLTQIDTKGANEINSDGFTVADFTFKPTTDLGAWDAIFGLTGHTVGTTVLNANTMVVLLEDTDQSFNSVDLGSIPGSITEALGGNIWATLGFDPTGLDHFWRSTDTPVDIATFASAPPLTDIGDFRYGLDVLQNFTPYTFQHMPNAQNIIKDYEFSALTGNVYSPSTGNRWPIEDDIKASFRVTVTVPEPASLALLGLGLVGMGLGTRRRKAV